MGHMATSRSFYEILGIAQDAQPEAVRKAYKRKVLQTHPDKLPTNATEVQKQAAETMFRDVYDNGLNYIRGRAHHDELQAKLAREREEWAKQATQRNKQQQQERTKARREELEASRMRFEETRKKAELRYKERVRDLEEQVKVSREKMQRGQEAMRQANTMAADSYALTEEILAEIRKKNPEWETRRQEALRRQAERMNSQDSSRRMR
ncbi:hypothetical protein NLI96_g10618 [Meripilus lineatus]|uniref:J domain-containing protein n=1 Tax=Meripilus lineatus TaxID=2056292 RepID=A0AAD5UTL1_9APHY|nr:hypothetical protein NLI96_g10618 [Physisporinus lineatus]